MNRRLAIFLAVLVMAFGGFYLSERLVYSWAKTRETDAPGPGQEPDGL